MAAIYSPVRHTGDDGGVTCPLVDVHQVLWHARAPGGDDGMCTFVR